MPPSIASSDRAKMMKPSRPAHQFTQLHQCKQPSKRASPKQRSVSRIDHHEQSGTREMPIQDARLFSNPRMENSSQTVSSIINVPIEHIVDVLVADISQSGAKGNLHIDGDKCHYLWRVVAQIAFGIHLLHEEMAMSVPEVIKILQTHVDEMDAFLEITTEDFDLSQTDIEQRVSSLEIPLNHQDVFDQMLKDKLFRDRIVDGNHRIEHIIKRTAIGMNRSLIDVREGIKAVDELSKYLLRVDSGWDDRSDGLLRVYASMSGTVEGWYRCLAGLQSKGNALGVALAKLSHIVGKIEMCAAVALMPTPNSRAIHSSRVARNSLKPLPQDPPLTQAERNLRPPQSQQRADIPSALSPSFAPPPPHTPSPPPPPHPPPTSALPLPPPPTDQPINFDHDPRLKPESTLSPVREDDEHDDLSTHSHVDGRTPNEPDSLNSVMHSTRPRNNSQQSLPLKSQSSLSKTRNSFRQVFAMDRSKSRNESHTASAASSRPGTPSFQESRRSMESQPDSLASEPITGLRSRPANGTANPRTNGFLQQRASPARAMLSKEDQVLGRRTVEAPDRQERRSRLSLLTRKISIKRSSPLAHGQPV